MRPASWLGVGLAVLVVSTTVLAGAGAPRATAAPAATPGGGYYLALGDSLAVGVQPDPSGVARPTDEGYADQLAARLRGRHPGLRLVKLGCPGETAESMIAGGSCAYPGGSQLVAAEQFLRRHGAGVRVVTLDIGANDYLACLREPLVAQVPCFARLYPRVAEIARRLRAAAPPGTAVVGMTYYNPLLASWFRSPIVARVAAARVHNANAALSATFAVSGVRVADVAEAFRSGDFSSAGDVPVNVRTICARTWMCRPDPDIHANRRGYALIAATFAAALRDGDRLRGARGRPGRAAAELWPGARGG